ARWGKPGSGLLIRRSKAGRSPVRAAFAKASTVALTRLSRELTGAADLVSIAEGAGAPGEEQAARTSVSAPNAKHRAAKQTRVDTDTKGRVREGSATWSRKSAWPASSSV